MEQLVTLIDVEEARRELFRRLVDAHDLRGDGSEPGRALRRERAALMVDALMCFAKALNPRQAEALSGLFLDVDFIIHALITQNDTPGGHPDAFEPSLPIGHRKPYPIEMDLLQAAAAAAITILLEEKLASEPEARKQVARALKSVGERITRGFGAITLKNWRSDVTSDPKESRRYQFYAADVQSWREVKGTETASKFIAKILRKAQEKAAPGLPDKYFLLPSLKEIGSPLVYSWVWKPEG